MKENLNILFLNSWYPSRVLPTNGDFIQRHAEAVALQHKVSVVHVISDKNLKEKIEISDTTINSIRTIIAYIKPTSNPLLKWYRFFKAYKIVLKKAGTFDLIHVNKFYPGGLIAYFQKKRYKTPYIITEHHTQYHYPYSQKISSLELNLSKIIIRNANFVCPVSDDLGEAMQKFGLKGNYHTVPNVVDTKRFLAKNNRDNDVFTILHVSSMAAVKNIEGLLHVAKKLEKGLKKFKFYFIGGNAEDFKKNAKDLNLNFDNLVFKNQVTHKEITAYFQLADVFVLFSDVENLPCVILESFSCGTPVVSTHVGGISEFFPDDYGLLVKARDEDEMYNAILKIKNNFSTASPNEMHQYVVANFSEQQIANKFSKYYYKALNNE